MRSKDAIWSLTHAATRAPRRTLLLAALFLIVAAVVGAPVVSSLQPFSSEDPQSQSVAARRAIERATGVDPYFNLIALVPTPAGPASADARARLGAVQAAFAADPLVASVHSYYHRPQPGLVARGGQSTLVVGDLRTSPIAEQLAAARAIRGRLASLRGVQLGGLAAFYAEGNDTAREDLIRAELLAFPLLLLITLWVFRGLVAALLPLLIGAVTIIGTFAALRLLSEITDVSIYALNIATALGLGLAVDYSLLIISRYREEIAIAGMGSGSLVRTVQSAGRTVAISSLTVAGVLSCLLVFPQPFLRSIGLGGMLVAVLAGGSALIVLPAILTLLRWRINSLSPQRWHRAAYRNSRPAEGGPWYRIPRFVMGHPRPIAAASIVLLLALASPAIGLRLTQVDANDVPRGSSSRLVSEAIEREYPAVDRSPAFVALAPTGTDGAAEVGAYAERLRGLADVAAVQSPVQLNAGLWQVDVTPASAPLSSASQRLIAEIRATPFSGRTLVGGESASLVDLKHSLSTRLPYALLILLLVSGGAVFLLTGSLVLPIKALLMNVLTIAATFGVMVLVFQRGALEGLLAYTGSNALEAATMVLISALAFGLATDYGIFLLSRIKEVRDGGADDREAVARGLERTGPVVTAAALILCVAFASLVSARHALVKEVGFGAALAVAIDATIVRVLLLPSLMAVFGRWNWWGPGARAQARWRGGQLPPATPAPADGTTAGVLRAPRRRLGQHLPAAAGEALSPTRYCDSDSSEVRATLEDVRGLAGGDGERELAVAAFEFVRDNVRYRFGPWGVSASDTLGEGGGTCTNKANLLVALLRAAGIPAAYGVMRVNARRYFGVLGPPFLSRYCAVESTHVYAGVFLDGRWLKCDPSTDDELAERTAHFCHQTTLIEWDGSKDALDFLDPEHVYADLGLFADLDGLLSKPARLTTSRLQSAGNDWLAFIRDSPPFPSDAELVDAYKASREVHGFATMLRLASALQR